MLKIGYVRPQDGGVCQDTARLEADGCQVVRAETATAAGATLESILTFLGPGDELVVVRLDALSPRTREVREALDRLEARGARLRVLSPELSTAGAGGAALRAALDAVAALEPAARRRAPAAAHEIHALQRAGLGPVEIARRLGVSRMTVWRKLRAAEGAARA